MTYKELLHKLRIVLQEQPERLDDEIVIADKTARKEKIVDLFMEHDEDGGSPALVLVTQYQDEAMEALLDDTSLSEDDLFEVTDARPSLITHGE